MTVDARQATGNTISHNHKVALDLAAKGVAIFPCQPVDGPPDQTGHPQWRAKRPMPRIKWKEAATIDIEIINAWWGANPDALVGMPLGPLDILVLDPDQHPGSPDGIKAFNELCKTSTALGDGPYVETPNGRHYLFRQITPRHGNSEGTLPKGINVRGEGGYVIAPGCVLPDGRGWTLMRAELPIPELPQAIVAMLQGVAPPEEPASQSHDPIDDITYPDDARYGPYMRKVVKNAYDKVAKELPGHRNNTLNTQAMKLGHFVPRFLDEREITDLLRDACIANGLDHGVDATIRSGLGDGMKQPIDPLDLANEYWDGDFEQAFGETPPKQTNKPRIWRGDEMWDIPPVSYLIGNLIPRGTVGLMVGDSQTFKSFMALDMALAICQGQPKWHGHVIEAPDDAIVLYIAGEGGIEGISQRRRGWATYHKLTRATMRDRFRLITHGVNLTSKDSRKLLVEAITEQLAQDKGKLVLIIVDTLNTVASGAEENSTKEMGALHNICVEISRHFDTAVMGVHHTNKKGDVRGSSVLTANMDFWMFIKRRVFSSMKIEMTIGKLKDAGAGHKEKYEMKLVGIDGSSATTLVPIRIGAEEDEIEVALGGRPAPRTEAIIETLTGVADGLTLTELCDLLGITERKERQAVRRALYRGRVTGGFAHHKGKWSVTDDGGFFS